MKLRCSLKSGTLVIPAAAGLSVWLLAVTAFRALPASVHAASSQDPLSFEAKLGTRRGPLNSNGRTLLQSVISLAYEFQFPVGFEYLDREAVQGPLNIRLRRPSVREMIEALVNELPEYRVSFSNGVVEVYSPLARSERANVLNTVIPEFAVRDADPEEASTAVLEALLRSEGTKTALVESTALGSPLKVNIHRKDAKVYEILDAIVAQHGRLMWTVTASPERLTTVHGDLWYVYPLDPPQWERIVIDRTQRLFPPKATGQSEPGN